MTDTAVKETYEFQAEVGRILEIVTHSLYSNREVFLRELISNASDACDKLRHMALTQPELIQGDTEFRITIHADKEANTLTVTDNGIGMDRDDLLETLGTIAKSGIGAFLDKLKEDDKNGLNLIGQFGVGFYSSFMVATKVDVLTRKAGTDEAHLWSSEGQGEFSVEPAERDGRGTTITLHLKEDASEFLEKMRIQRVVQTYSDHIGFPILWGQGENVSELNEASALWTRPAKDITPEQYKEFYHHVTKGYDEPSMTIHNRVEGVVSYTNLLFVPTMPPFDLFSREQKSHVKLYVNRVLITEEAKDLLPHFLRFVQGVVDSEDLSLNVSREMLQTDAKLAKIKSSLTKRILKEFGKYADKDAEEYSNFWKKYGAVIKEGLVEDPALQERILEVCRFNSTHGEGLFSLKEYMERMSEGQEAIYYIVGTDAKKIASSPHLEAFRAKGVEVLLLSDQIDEYWVNRGAIFGEKQFKSVTEGANDLDKVEGEDKKEDEKETEDKAANVAPLIGAIKVVLDTAVKDVRVSKRLHESPVCLVGDDGGMDIALESLLRQQGKLNDSSRKILEINADHDLIRKLAERAKADNAAEDVVLEDAAYLLLDQARIADGDDPVEPAEFTKRLARVMSKAL
ncbi:molecular chaperone HtpG [Roseibium sp. RKSG952]|uniref:molecular chaperone HtpG n=1 Tax=Roseibium sp. RKSG952 TaxID=2529384 RepID=UPI0012BC6C87|nr:molecular chaperone HtpG [Roseibium sp. RKSG952]MTI00183.1 molecular chaperone HtpG [Roseibium sp. RKSG952]